MLIQFPPMGVYETLFKFADATNKYMGDGKTHPWAQGYPITSQLPNGPALPDTINLDTTYDLKYPKATGEIELRTAISDYYNNHYDAGITPDNVGVFAGGRPGLMACMTFLESDICVALEETEYTPYWDMFRLLDRKVHFIPSNTDNNFRPSDEDYDIEPIEDTKRVFLLKSNPCNPTGVSLEPDRLRNIVKKYSQEGKGALFDEAYEFYNDPEPMSAIQYVDNIDDTDIFIAGAATKGLQVPGMRVGWIIAAKKHIELFRNYSSIGMGGVSRASQLYVTQLLEKDRVSKARQAVCDFFMSQRKRYEEGLSDLGFELYTGCGGFYHWGLLPNGISADEFNERLFKYDAGILPGYLCDMTRDGESSSPMDNFIRFSFGPLDAGSYESDMEILSKCV